MDSQLLTIDFSLIPIRLAHEDFLKLMGQKLVKMASVRREVSFLPIARLIIGKRKLSLTIFPPMSGFGGLLIITVSSVPISVSNV